MATLIHHGSDASAGDSLHRDVWTLDDRLRYSLHVEAFASLIRDGHARAPLVVAIQGPWGSGKTSFMRMVQRCLDPRHPDLSALPQNPPTLSQLRHWLSSRTPLQCLLDVWARLRAKPRLEHPTVWFNAWHHQNSSELWAGLAHTIISQLSGRLPVDQRERFWLSLQRNRLDRNRLRSGLVSLLIEHAVPIIVGILLLVALVILKGNDALNATGVVIVSLLATVPVFLALRTALSDMVKGAYMNVVRDPDYRGRMGVLDLTQADILFSLARLVDDDHPAIVFIDDLDRCFPAHVAEVIGAINLFLANNHRSCIFVLGMDTEVVAASLEVVHEKVVGKVSKRDGELGWNYMDKFVQLPIALPRVQEDDRLAYFRDLLAGRSNNVHPITSSIATEADGLNERADLLIDNIHELGVHLSLNPRTLVKISNIFRFQMLLQAARKNAGSEPASEQQILLWSIVFARWPHFVRWLQRLPTEKSRESPALGRIIERARMTNSADAWATELDTDGFDHGGWAQTPGLWEFFHKENAAPDLEQASKVGFW